MPVEFDEPTTYNRFKSRVILDDSLTPKMFKWVIQHGIVKTEQQAQYLFFSIIITALLGIAIIVFLNPLAPKQKIPQGYRVVNTPGQLPNIVPVP